MDFKVFSKALGNIIKTVEDTAYLMVRALKIHTYSINIKNWKKTQTVKGTVIVSNQKKVEKELKESKKIQKSVLKYLLGFKMPTKFEVSNLKDLPDFPKKLKVTNFDELVGKMPDYPEPLEEIHVSNQPTTEIKEISNKLVDVFKAIKKLKLDPKINVQAPKAEKIIVPPANVSITQEKIDYKKLASLIPIPEKIDYKKLAESIGKELAEMMVTTGGGSGGGKPFSQFKGDPERALLDSQRRIITSPGYTDLTKKYNVSDKDDSGDTKYYGFIDGDGAWYIMEEDTTANTYRYFKGDGVSPNEDYPSAWNSRADHEYDYYNEIF